MVVLWFVHCSFEESVNAHLETLQSRLDTIAQDKERMLEINAEIKQKCDEMETQYLAAFEDLEKQLTEKEKQLKQLKEESDHKQKRLKRRYITSLNKSYDEFQLAKQEHVRAFEILSTDLQKKLIIAYRCASNRNTSDADLTNTIKMSEIELSNRLSAVEDRAARDNPNLGAMLDQLVRVEKEVAKAQQQ